MRLSFFLFSPALLAALYNISMRTVSFFMLHISRQPFSLSLSLFFLFVFEILHISRQPFSSSLPTNTTKPLFAMFFSHVLCLSSDYSSHCIASAMVLLERLVRSCRILKGLEWNLCCSCTASMILLELNARKACQCSKEILQVEWLISEKEIKLRTLLQGVSCGQLAATPSPHSE